MTAPRCAVQVQVVDGRIVVNQQSLTVQAQAGEAITRVVREDTAKLNSMTYMRTIGNERWSAADTELFYKVGRVGAERVALVGVGLGWGSKGTGAGQGGRWMMPREAVLMCCWRGGLGWWGMQDGCGMQRGGCSMGASMDREG